MQQLTSRLAALGRFISRFINCIKPFFAILKEANRARWNEECDQAFTQIKQYLAKPPILPSSDTSKTLFVYLAVSEVAVSVALFKENNDIRQKLVFFVSKSLTDAETRYSHLEQAALALRITTKKLHPYFQAHSIVVQTDLPLQSTLHKPDFSGRMARGAIKLSEYGHLVQAKAIKKRAGVS